MIKILNCLKKSIIFIITSILSILLIVSLLSLYLNLTGKLVIYKIDGPSMLPNYQDDNYIVVSNFSQDYQRGDVVAIKMENDRYIIKRLIGLPNEHILFVNKDIYINDQIYEENHPMYLSQNYINEDIKLKGDEIFVMGDNRDKSYDCRNYGPLKYQQIIGKVIYQLNVDDENIFIKQIEQIIKNMKGEK